VSFEGTKRKDKIMCEQCQKQTSIYENMVIVHEKMSRLFQRLIETLDSTSTSLPDLSGPAALINRPLSKAEAQNILQVSETKLGKLLQRGEIPYFRIGKQVRIRPEDLNSYLFNLIN
jgi:excisionase family DNA binding protein